MEYSEFAEKAILQDKRNVFSKYDSNLDAVPDIIKTFYRNNNPLNVEINAIRFIPSEELDAIQSEYSY